MKNRIELVVDRIVEERRWRPFRDREITIVSEGPPISACITLHDRKIHLSFSEHFEQLLAGMIRDHQLPFDVSQASEAIVSHLFVHEYNHHQYCPANDYLFNQIIEGIREVIEPRESRESRVRAVAFEIHNMFSDTIINTIESHKDEQYRTGQGLAALLVLYSRSRQSLFGARTDKAMQLFLESNLYLCGLDDSLYREAKRYLPRFFRGEQQAVKALLWVFLDDPALVERSFSRELLGADSEPIIGRMCVCDRWREMARNYATIIHPYLRHAHSELQNSFSGKQPAEGRPAASSQPRPGDSTGAGSGRSNRATAAGDFQSEGCPEGQACRNESGAAKPKAGTGAGEASGQDRQARSTEGDPGSGAGPSDTAVETAVSAREDGGTERVVSRSPASDGQSAPCEESDDSNKNRPAEEKSPVYGSRGVIVPIEPLPLPPFPLTTMSGPPGKNPVAGEHVRMGIKARPGTGTLRTLVRFPGGKSASTGSGLFSRQIDVFERLDQLYSERAGKLLLEQEDPNGPNLEVSVGSEDTDLGDAAGVRLPPSVLLRKRDGSMLISLRKRRFPLTLDTAVMPELGGLPNLCFVYDSSGSMHFSPESGVGEYHIAILTFYSIVQALREKGVAPLLQYNGMNFSDMTFSSGWQPYSRLEEVKRALLSYQGGGTTIRVSELAELREQRKDRYLILLFSDLAITNIGELAQELIETSRSRAASVLVFKLGGEDVTTERLKSAGIEIHYPRDAQEFMNSSIRILKDAYDGALS